MRNPKISVVVPVYNVEQYVSQCLDSIINQTYSNIEVIVVNDGSTDNSLSILKSYANKDNRIKIINKKNGGQSSARNEGIKYASGEYLTFIDSDDWIDADCLHNILKIIKGDIPDVILWSYTKDYETKSIDAKVFNAFKAYDKGNIDELYCRLIGPRGNELSHPEKLDCISTICMKLFKTKIIVGMNIKFTDLNILGSAEDLLFNVEYFRYVNSAVVVPESYYHYRRNSGSYTHRYKSKLIGQWTELQNRIWDIIKDRNSEFIRAFNNRIAISILQLALNEYGSGNSYFVNVKNIRRILSVERYKNALSQLQLKFFPIHWKVFFFCAKYGLVNSMYCMVVIIQKFFR
jgi:glycosyltransferase EpsH